ncbi:Herc, partial [Acrasis kona]
MGTSNSKRRSKSCVGTEEDTSIPYRYDVHQSATILPSTSTKMFVFGECKNQLGIGVTDNHVQSEPALIEHLQNHKIVKICTGFVHSVALTLNGKVYTFGCGDDGKLGYIPGANSIDSSRPNLVTQLQNEFVVDVSAGYNHTMFLTRRGAVCGAGNNSYSQLCCSQNFKSGTVQHALEYDRLQIIKIVCGYYHTILISATGKVYYKGKDSPDQDDLGEITSLNDQHIVSAGAGYSHTIFLTKRGQVYVYGDNSAGQLGLDELVFHTIPKLLPNLEQIVSCDGGYYHTIFLSKDGSVYTAGSSQYGKLGIGLDDIFTHGATMLQEFGAKNMVANSVSAGGYHSAVSTIDGKVFVFGHGSFGQCGQGGNLDNFLTPVRVEAGGVNNLFFSQVSAGGWHTVLLERSTGLFRRLSISKSMLEKTTLNRLAF